LKIDVPSGSMKARAQKNSCGGGFGNFKLFFGNVGAKLAKD
jgi:hypothetical protein